MTIRRAAELADAWVPGPTAGMPKLLELRAAYDAALTDAGVDLASVPRPITREVIIAPTDARGARPGREAPDGQLPRGVRRRHLEAPAHRRRGLDPPRSRSRRSAATGSSSAHPRPAIKAIRTFQEQLGIDHLICRLFFPGMPHDHIMSEIRLLAEEVIPAFR